MSKGKKVKRSIFKLLTGVIVGSAIGSILGITLAPKSGKESREYLRKKSMEMFSKETGEIQMDTKKKSFLKRALIGLLKRKKRK
jgi:gas vesicle protein